MFTAETSDSESDCNNNTVLTTITTSNQTTDGLTRNRKRDPKKWKRNFRKILRMEGKEYQCRSRKKNTSRLLEK